MIEGAAAGRRLGPRLEKAATGIDSNSRSDRRRHECRRGDLRAAKHRGLANYLGPCAGDRPPGRAVAGTKIGRLEDYVQRNGGFSDDHGPYEIDIRHWHEITRQPLSELPGRTNR